MQLGRYTIERQLGAGGMSQVWLARSAQGAIVVLKRQLNPHDDDRLRQEGRIGMRLKHPGIVQTLELFEHDERPVLVLEYVPGASFAMVRRRAPVPPEAVCRMGADVAEALAALHGATDEAGRPSPIIHRDVSPANIIVSPDGRARLIDLGIARSTDDGGVERTRTGDLRGTVRYLAPELFEGKAHNAGTDLWALGVCLFEAALGRAAATGPEAVILARIVRGTLMALEPGEALHPVIANVLSRMCAPERERLRDGVEAAWLLSQGERSIGDGRLAAKLAVYMTLEDPPAEGDSSTFAASPRAAPVRPAGEVGDDAFLKFAASTYCSIDDDALAQQPFTSAVTAVTPHPPSRASVESLADGPTRPEPPASGGTFDDVRSDPSGELPSTALWTPEAAMVRVAPGALPASGDSWAIPPPTTGAGAQDDASAGALDASSRGLSGPMGGGGGFGAEPLGASTAPPLARPPQTTTLPTAPDPVLEELMQGSRVPWVPLAVGAALVLVAAIVLLAR